MNKEVKKLVLNILEKAIEVSATTETRVSVNFAGCLYFEIRIHEGCKVGDGKLIYHYYTFLDMDKGLEDLNRMYREICKYEKK